MLFAASTHRIHPRAVIDIVGRLCRWECRPWEYASHVFLETQKKKTFSETRQQRKNCQKTHLSTTPEPVEQGEQFFGSQEAKEEKGFSINHRNSINNKVPGNYFFAWQMEKVLTALSPKFRTLQWSFADCPTVASTSRLVILSKNGKPYCVSHTGWASPLMISVADEWKTEQDKSFNNSNSRRFVFVCQTKR